MLTIKQVAQHLKCSRLVIDKLVEQGLPCVNISSSPQRRRLRFDLGDVQDWLKEERTKNWQSAKCRLNEAERELRQARAELERIKNAGEADDDGECEDSEDSDDNGTEDSNGEGDGDTNEA